MLATKPVALLNTTTEMQTCWLNSFCQLLMNIPSFVNHFINMNPMEIKEPELKLIFNLVRKFVFAPKKYYSLKHSRIARYDHDCFTAIIPCELMEFFEINNVLIGEDNDAGFRMIDFLKRLNELDPRISEIIGYKLIDHEHQPYRTNKTMLFRIDKPSIHSSYDYPLEGLRGILLFESEPCGHWNAFIRSMIDDKWRKFNDQEVTIIESIKDVQSRPEAIILCYDPTF